MKKVFISTTSFGEFDSKPLELLKNAGLDVQLNPQKRKLKEDELIEYLGDVDYLVAGTESLNKEVLTSAKNLEIISRCGVGVDSVDLDTAKQQNIKVFNTPFGPTQAVAEITIGIILNLVRQIGLSDREMRNGVWKKRMGNLLHKKKVGIVGFGRIGQRVAELLEAFNVEVGYCDPEAIKTKEIYKAMKKTELLSWADIVTIHCAWCTKGETLMGKEDLALMKPTSFLINMSRGGVVNEKALEEALLNKSIAGAALDVFEQEPYDGPFKNMDNVILTPHIGSYAKEARVQMEIDCVQNLLQGIR